jgi:hypothetical protein
MTGVISGDPVGVGVKVGAGDAVLSTVLTGSSVGRSDGSGVSVNGVIVSTAGVEVGIFVGCIIVPGVNVGSNISTDVLFELHADSSRQHANKDMIK